MIAGLGSAGVGPRSCQRRLRASAGASCTGPRQRLRQGRPRRRRLGPIASPRWHIARWSAYAWGAIGAVAVFIAITCWWLTQDRSIPIYDAGDHLETALRYHNMLAAGNLLGPFTSDIDLPDPRAHRGCARDVHRRCRTSPRRSSARTSSSSRCWRSAATRRATRCSDALAGHARGRVRARLAAADLACSTSSCSTLR